MKKALEVLLVLALVAAVIGYFRNWYSVSYVREEQKTNIRISIDRQRIQEDLDLAGEKAQDVTNRIRSGNRNESAQESGSVASDPR
ncbi:MAG: hypothetical protein GX575_24385 [Candidatus Anammoximicrobium sp.]|nr:hypothetical protein [Candidatus Anammoximicrobium sp.]